MKKKLFAALFCLSVAAWLVSSTTVKAEEIHQHCICGEVHVEIGDHTTEVPTVFSTKLSMADNTLKKGDGEWTAINGSDGISYYELEAGSYYLESNLTLEHCLLLTGNVELCLNGYSIICSAVGNSVDTIALASYNLTLTNCYAGTEEGREGKITHSDGKYGSGVYNSRGIFNMYGGNISGNQTGNCSGVYNKSTFNMYGGSVSDNKALGAGNNGYGEGAGVYNCTKSGIFNLYGGTISGNTACRGGGVYNQEAVFNMYGGNIIGNKVSSSGGGVYCCLTGAKFCMYGGTIGGTDANDGNEAEYYGGGVFIVEGTFDMKNGTITGNRTTSDTIGSGGGVYNMDTFIMSGGFISGNTSGRQGGGVSNLGVCTISGGTVSKNEAVNNGGGIYNYKTFNVSGGNITGNKAPQGGGVSHYNGTMTLSGAPIITDNKDSDSKDNNVYLAKDKVLTANGLTTGAKIGINTSNTGTLVQGTTDTSIFFSDLSGEALITDGAGGLKLGDTAVQGHIHYLCGGISCSNVGGHTESSSTTFTEWTSTNSLPDIAGNYYLNEDVTLSETWYPKNGTVLCLNGKSIIASGDFDVVRVEPQVKFTLTDCIATPGRITHDAGKIGRGVRMYGTMEIYGGMICGNTAMPDNSYSNSTWGGGVYVAGTNQGSAKFVMYGGSISGGNNATYGGGVYVGAYSTDKTDSFTMYGGTINGNTATGYGGGAYIKGNMTVSGGAGITGNTVSKAENNAFLENSNTITIGGILTGKIGVSKYNGVAGDSIATGADENADYSGIIVSDETKFQVVHGTDKTTLVLANSNTEMHTHSWSEWQHNDTQHWKVCSGCSQEADRANHTWDKGVITLEPTSTTKGEKTFTCEICKAIRTEAVDKLPEDSYKILEGANSSWTQNSNGTLTFRANGDFSKFTGVKVDGKLIDADKYTAVAGSTVITLKSDYLATLSDGSHSLTVVYNDGECSTDFVVKAIDGSKNDNQDDDQDNGQDYNSGSNRPNEQNPVTTAVTSPETGDTSNVLLWITLLIISAGIVIGITIISRKKENNK